MPLLLTPRNEPAELRERLAELRGRWRRWLIIRWLALVAGCGLGLLLIVGVVDRCADIPAILRGVLLVGGCGAALQILARQIVPAWHEAGSDLSAALRIESRFPEFNDALASAIEFDTNTDAGSAALRAATRRYADREAADCDFNRLVETRPAVRALGLASLAITAVLAIAIWSPEKSALAAARLFDPFGDHPWPPETLMTIAAPEWLARGEPFVLRGELRGIIPDRAEVRWAIENSPEAIQPLAVTLDGDTGSFGLRLEPNRVARTFRYQVQANDATTPWRTVSVLPPPELVNLNGRASPQVHADFPAYTELKAVDFPDGGSSVEGVTGTRLRIRAAANRPLSRAWIEPASDAAMRFTAPLASLGAVQFWDGLTRSVNGVALAGPTEGRLDKPVAEAARTPSETPNSHEFAYPFELIFIPPVSGRYALRFADDTSLSGHRDFEIRLVPDPSPSVTLERPAASRDSLAVVPDASITLQARVDDPIFAVRSAWLEYRTSDGAATVQPLESTPVIRPPSRRPMGLLVDQKLELKNFKHHSGRPLKDGDVLTLAVAADDFDDVTTAKPPGRSHEVELRIVSPSALGAIVQKSQAEIQRELQALEKLQRDARARAATANEHRQQTGTLRPEDRERLVQSGELQQQLRQRLGDERTGLRGAVEQLRQTFRDNPLPGAEAERERAEALAKELDRLSREELEPIEPLLTAARIEQGTASQEERRSGALAKAARLQRDAERALHELSERMRAWSQARELRAEAALIERDQARVEREREQLESQPGVRGSNRQSLPPNQQEALSRLAERQSAVADRANELVQKLSEQAAQMQSAADAKLDEAKKLEAQAAGDPAKAALLQSRADEARDAAAQMRREADALAKARDITQSVPSLANQLQNATRALEGNKLGDAQSAQQAAGQMLQRVQEALAEAPERDVDRLAKRLQETEKAIDELADAQERLQKRATEAQALADPQTRKEALQQLSRQQDELRERAEELAQRLSRQGQESAAQQLRRAASDMAQARENIDQGDRAEDKQDDALDRLDDAQDQVQQARRQLEDQLQRETRAKMVDALKGFVGRQAGLSAESERVFQAVRAEKIWTRALQKSLIDLGQAEQSLSGELDHFTEDSLKDAKVVAHLVREASGAMKRVGPAVESVRQGPMDQESLDDDRRTVRSPQETASRRLKQLIDALKEADKQDQQRQRQQGQKSQEEPPGQSGPAADVIPSVVELKLLRSLQAELNDRTNTFAQDHPDPKKWTDAERAEIAALRKSQSDLAALLESLSPAEPPAPEPKEKKQ